MQLIALTGRRGSGKDTTFGLIERWAEGRGLVAERRAFADKLKISAARALGMDLADPDAIVVMDSLKLAGEISTTVFDQSIMISIDGREFLQRYGTEAHRDVFGFDFWVDALLPLPLDGGPDAPLNWEDNFGGADLAVVTDLRFDNEAQRVKDLGGVVWEIYRQDGKIPSDAHASEAGIDEDFIDLVVYNNGHDLDLLADEVEAACRTLNLRERT